MAQKFNADWVLIDEKIGRNMAEYLGLRVTGTLGILLNAKRKGWISSFQACVLAMQEQGIRYHPQLVARLVQEAGEFWPVRHRLSFRFLLEALKRMKPWLG